MSFIVSLNFVPFYSSLSECIFIFGLLLCISSSKAILELQDFLYKSSFSGKLRRSFWLCYGRLIVYRTRLDNQLLHVFPLNGEYLFALVLEKTVIPSFLKHPCMRQSR